MKYPIYQPNLGGNEKRYVNEALDSTWISSKGPFVERFEEMVAEAAGVKHAAAVSNGTVALHLALLSAGIGPGDTVIVPNLTYVASANAVLYCGADVRLVDVDADTWNISDVAIRSALDDTVKAVITTDLYGVPCDLQEETRRRLTQVGVVVIEDAAEAIGSSIDTRRAGSLGEIATFSFFGNKTVTTGEGGMVVTNDDTYDEILRKLKNQGNSDTRRYFHDVLGYNYRMTNIQAAIGVAQMERLPEIIERKQQIDQWYRQALSEQVRFQVIPDQARPNAWLVSVLLPDSMDRDVVARSLAQADIETRPVFVPISHMPYMPEADTPITEHISARGLSLPSYPDLNRADVESIAAELLKAMEQS